MNDMDILTRSIKDR